MSTDTKKYEVTFIMAETANPEQATAKATDVTKFIASLGGEVTKEEQWGRRELAYAIKRNRTGHYVTLWFDLPANQVKPLERFLGFEESIIRSLVTLAYTTAQPGSLYPVVEEEKRPAGRRAEKEESTTAEEQLRRSSAAPKASKKSEEKEEEIDELSEEERLTQLDTQLDELLKEEESN